LITQSNTIDIHAVFYWDKKTDTNFDIGFGREVVWDVPLLEGYSNDYLSETKQSRIQKLIALWKLIDKNQFDIVWTHGYADLYSIAAIVFAKLKGLKVFVRGESLYFPQDKKSFKKKCFFKILDQFVDRYLAIGTHNRDFYLKNNVAQDKIFLCHYVVDNNFFRNQYLRAKENSNVLRESLGLVENRPVILYASKFIERKYPIDLLNAYLQLPSDNRPYLLFIGTGETWDAVVKAADNNPDIRFLGFKNQSELPDYFALADVLVLPSKRENWGLIVNEAMNADCAIIVSDEVGCGIDLVKHGENGFIYKARDVATLSQYLKELTSDAPRCEQMKLKSAEIISHWGLSEAVAGLEKAAKSLSKI
jgi:glycosyltransferase involved in cell wall biosynthesis